MTEHVRSETAGGILSLVMNRPDKKNALTDAMYARLADSIDAAEADPAIRVILLRGEGDMFTAGNDLGEFAALAASGAGLGNVGRFIRGIATMNKPLVAAVQGRAVGVGTTLLLHCDHVVLAEGAQLTTPFVGLALVPEAASSLLLPSRIGHVRAFSMFALGEPVSAEDAVAWGLANRVVPAESLVLAAEEVARKIARQPLGALMATKRLMRATETMTTQIDIENLIFGERLLSDEAKEAFTAFAQKRAPDFGRFG